MSTTEREDITWDILIRDSEIEIAACQRKITELRKSIRFFRKQAEMGMKFPLHKDKASEATNGDCS